MVNKELEVMESIQKEKESEIKRDGVIPLDDEGVKLAEHCQYTIDNPLPLVTKKADPKR